MEKNVYINGEFWDRVDSSIESIMEELNVTQARIEILQDELYGEFARIFIKQ